MAKMLWRDAEIRFDPPSSQLALLPGEHVVDVLCDIEDTKGNNGRRGTLVVTSLRLVWLGVQLPGAGLVLHDAAENRQKQIKDKRQLRSLERWLDRIDMAPSLSIGFDCISSAAVRPSKSRLRGGEVCESLFVLARFRKTRFEFIFTSAPKSQSRHFATYAARLFDSTQSVLRAYESSRLFRELRLRGALVDKPVGSGRGEGELVLLPRESVIAKIHGVWNLSVDQNFNVSVPHIQIRTAMLRQSKFGIALVLETFQRVGGFILGFRVDDEAELKTIAKQVKATWSSAQHAPDFGVQVQQASPQVPLDRRREETVNEGVRVLGYLESDAEEDESGSTPVQRSPKAKATRASDVTSAFYALPAAVDAENNVEKIVASNDLAGLAIQQLPSNVDIDSLWYAPVRVPEFLRVDRADFMFNARLSEQALQSKLEATVRARSQLRKSGQLHA
ncbi:MAG: hypothetical protein MHM6MM_000575 [Cercozoa sp. M6MM]